MGRAAKMLSRDGGSRNWYHSPNDPERKCTEVKKKKTGISVTVPDISVCLIKYICETCPLLLNNPQVGESGEQIC